MDDFTNERAVREEILNMCVEALRVQFPELTTDAIAHDPASARACVALLRDCRPIAAIRHLIAELEPAAAAFSSSRTS